MKYFLRSFSSSNWSWKHFFFVFWGWPLKTGFTVLYVCFYLTPEYTFAMEANTVNPGQTAIRSSLIWQYWLPNYFADKSADKSWMAVKRFIRCQNALLSRPSHLCCISQLLGMFAEVDNMFVTVVLYTHCSPYCSQVPHHCFITNRF